LIGACLIFAPADETGFADAPIVSHLINRVRLFAGVDFLLPGGWKV
jgi:hypothetical protein